MGYRKTMSMLAVLLLLVAAALVIEKPWRGKEAQKNVAPVLVSVDDVSEITGIAIEGPRGSVKLARGGEGWELLLGESRLPADEELVGQLLDAVPELNRGTLVSREGTGKTEFGVGEETGIRLTYSRGEEVVGDVVTGSGGPDFFSGYVRPRESGETLLVGVLLRPLLDREPEKWRDLDLMGFDPDEVAGIEMADAERSVSLARKDGSWEVQDPPGRAVDPSEVDRLLVRLSELRAIRAADAAVGESRGETSLRVTVSLKDGSSQGIEVGAAADEENEEYFISPLGRNEVFLIWDTTVKELSRLLDAVSAG